MRHPGALVRVDAPEPQPMPGDSPPRTPTLARYTSAVLRKKWLILTTLLVGSALGVVGSQMASLEYQAQATLWVAAEQSDEDAGPIMTSELLSSFAWIELLRSYTVLDHVVEEQQLFVQPAEAANAYLFETFRLTDRFLPGDYEFRVNNQATEVALLDSEGTLLHRVPVGEPLGTEQGFDWIPPAGRLRPRTTAAFTVHNPRDVAVRLGESIQTSMAENGNFLRLSLSGAEPEGITTTLNALADRYVSVAAQLKRSKLDELTEVLEEQRRFAENNLRDAEIALENFRVQTITLPSDQSVPIAAGLEITRDPVFESFFDLRVTRDNLREDREAIERIAGQAAEDPSGWQALAAVPAARDASNVMALLAERGERQNRLRELQQRYTNEHRLVVQELAELDELDRQTLPAAVATLRRQLVDQELEMDGRIEASSSELRQIPPRAIEEARLRRRVTIAENLHTTLRQRFEEARLAAAASIPDIRVLDAAVVPHQPTADSRILLLLLGVVGGLGSGLLGAIVLDRVDGKVRYPEQITHDMGIPILGMIPEIKRDDSALIRSAEAFREIRLGLANSHRGPGPLAVTISSPESGDGKSFVSLHLARSFADQGCRTLLIDADVRRGLLHRSLGLRRQPGLTDFLAGSVLLEEIVQVGEHPALSFIGSGRRLPNGPELLSGQNARDLMAILAGRYEVIIFDSPPLGAGVDPYLLSALTRNLLLVFRVGRTDRGFAEARLEPLRRLPIRLIGSVLNATSSSGVYRYYQYLPGYDVEPEEEDDVTLVPELAST